MLSGISQTEKDRYCTSHLRVKSIRYNKLVNIKKKETDSQIEQVSGEREGGRGNKGVED